MNSIAQRSAPLSREESAMIGQSLYDDLMSNDPSRHYKAASDLSSYTRVAVREKSFLDLMIPPQQITDADLDRQLNTDGNVYIADVEPESPGAMSVPLATGPLALEMRARRYPIILDRSMTNVYHKDVSKLRTWIMDLRQILSDLSLKDLHTERDRRFMTGWDTLLGSMGSTNPMTQTVMYKSLPGGINRNSLFDMTKITRDTRFAIATKTVLTNHITIIDVAKQDRGEFGGDLAEAVFRRGVAELEGLLGLNWVVTIKTRLVPNRHFYLAPDPEYWAKQVTLVPPTMHVKREAFQLEFFHYEETGIGFGHIGSSGHAYMP